MRFAHYQESIQVHEHETEEALIGDFLRRYPRDLHAITDREEYVIETVSLYELAKMIAEIMDPKYAIITGYSTGYIGVENEGQQITVIMNHDMNDGRTTEASRKTVVVMSTGPEQLVKKLFAELDKKFSHHEHTVIQWWYRGKAGLEHMAMVLEQNDPIYDEFYPWLEGGAGAYFDNFMNSNAPLLFISGPPGTGKTSYIRASIARHTTSAYVAYDPGVLERDDMFISFLSSKRDNVMVLEDSESVVLPRDKTGNSVMSRFLNVSDGLLKNNRKKFIFTTNDDNFERIDPALIRPGRCYDFVHFRKLSFEEARAAANKIKLPEPTEPRDHTLAELFNYTTKAQPVFKVGFRT